MRRRERLKNTLFFPNVLIPSEQSSECHQIFSSRWHDKGRHDTRHNDGRHTNTLIMILSTTKLSSMTLSTTTLRIATVSTMTLVQYNHTQHTWKSIKTSVKSSGHYAECRYAECRSAQHSHQHKKHFSVHANTIILLSKNTKYLKA